MTKNRVEKAMITAISESGDRVVDMVSMTTGATWNDGGHWNTGVFVVDDGTYRRVHQPSDYQSKLEIVAVVPVIVTTIEYKEPSE